MCRSPMENSSPTWTNELLLEIPAIFQLNISSPRAWNTFKLKKYCILSLSNKQNVAYNISHESSILDDIIQNATKATTMTPRHSGQGNIALLYSRDYGDLGASIKLTWMSFSNEITQHRLEVFWNTFWGIHFMSFWRNIILSAHWNPVNLIVSK